jgi:alkanesulfonate monooxygenase SsuD/methylene tetrahydromethanopterin reductase-like flavin-dependent oxidoreductase (luciferase family)
MNLIGAILARNTTRAKLLLLGNVLPIWDNPVRLAEEIAMLDILSNGRVISGFVRGVGVESIATNTNPVHNRERFEEAHDLVLKTWTTPGPFRWEGKHFHFRVVNPWIVPMQLPHPPIWVPGSASPETVQWAARRGYTYAAFLTPLGITKELFQLYRETAAAVNQPVSPDNFAYLLCCYVSDSEAKAQEEARHFLWRMGETLRGPREYFAPPGYRSRAGTQLALRRRTSEATPLNQQSLDELQANYHIVAGTPDTVLRKLKVIKDELGVGHLIFYGQESRMSHAATMRSIDLFGREVMPAIKESSQHANRTWHWRAVPWIPWGGSDVETHASPFGAPAPGRAGVVAVARCLSGAAPRECGYRAASPDRKLSDPGTAASG